MQTKSKVGGSKGNREIVSLFTGAMGLDLGFHAAGFKTKVCVEFDKNCAATIGKNCKSATVLHTDIKKLLLEDPELLQIRKHLSFASPFAVIGGPPCQAFSTAGKREGTQDIRGTLIFDFIRVIGVLRPEFFVMENVKGLLQHVVEEDAGAPLLSSVIKAQMEALGYKVVMAVVNAADYGVAQTRERVVFIGSRNAEPAIPVKSSKERVTLRSVIGDLVDNPGPCARFTPKLLKFLKFVPAGGNWRSLSPVMQERALGGAYTTAGGKAGFYRKLSWDKPAPTLLTSPTQKATLLCHPEGNRPLSVAEYARIQGFPDGWEFSGNTMSHYRQIGNAVPVGLGAAIARAIKKAWKANCDKSPSEQPLKIAKIAAGSRVKAVAVCETNLHNSIELSRAA